ncbi:metallophosphoesterase [Flavobacterium sp.]|uniref:metallophosphoesterase n=1 Tax=Flavobacterium sp. TaxID=239 RepID=UPI0039E6824A
MLRFWIIFTLVLLLIEFYAFQAFRTVIKTRWMLGAYIMVSLFVVGFIFYAIAHYDRSVGQTKQTLMALGLLLLIYIPKILLMFFMFGEDVYRVFRAGCNYFYQSDVDAGIFPARRKFVSQIGLGLAAVPFLSLIYGMTIGKYNYKVMRQQVFFPDLPDAFDGFKLTQISDVHSGSFDNPDKINHAIDLINEQDSDLILFTGDIVNVHAKEMHPWIEAFNRIRPHAFGKYSVLGNHDYGEYVEWPSQKEKAENFAAIKDLHRQIDFKLMLNEHAFLQKGNDKIALVGVENWGRNFKQAGDLRKASEGLQKEDFKILMSHDPSHWEEQVKRHEKNFHLTLSGHTHGLQFGIEIPGFFKWSPAQYIYKQWAGLYEEFGRYVYVNRGFGFHAYPGRVGIMPEITVIELKKGEKLA